MDKNTFEKYQQCSDPVFQPRFQELIQVTDSATPANYARISLDHGRCPFLSEKLCSIQAQLGEEYLSHTCATFPRNIRPVFGKLEKSLDPSCPEAARLILTDSRPIRLHLREVEEGNLPDQVDYRLEARSAVIAILQNRLYSLSQRLRLVAQLCDLLSEKAKPGKDSETRELLHCFRERVEGPLVEESFGEQSTVTQLELVLHLVNERIRFDFVSQRYLNLYREFADGIQMRAGSKLNDLASRFVEARQEYYAPFMDRHEYMLENYLVSHAFKTVFPFGWFTGDYSAECNLDPAQRFIVIGSYYAIIKTLLIGLAGKYKSEFGIEHVLHCVQSSSRALEHCIPYASKVLEILAGKGISTGKQIVRATGI